MKKEDREMRNEILRESTGFKGDKFTLSNERLQILKESILKELKFQKTINRKYNSYNFKHFFEAILGFYVGNLDLKLAMRQLNVPSAPQGTGRDVFYPISMQSARILSSKAGRSVTGSLTCKYSLIK